MQQGRRRGKLRSDGDREKETREIYSVKERGTRERTKKERSEREKRKRGRQRERDRQREEDQVSNAANNLLIGLTELYLSQLHKQLRTAF